MKKLTALFLSAILALSFTACGSSEPAATTTPDTADKVVVIDTGVLVLGYPWYLVMFAASNCSPAPHLNNAIISPPYPSILTATATLEACASKVSVTTAPATETAEGLRPYTSVKTSISAVAATDLEAVSATEV